MASQDWFEKDFYATLGVPSDAKPEAIKKAYRTLARQHHPDANGGDTAAERRFKEVGEAYGVLSDVEQRQQYDAVRAMSRGGARFTSGAGGAGGAGFEDLLGGLFGGGAGGAGGAGGPGGPNVRFSRSATEQADLQDLLNGMFGPGAAGAGRGQTGFQAPRGPQRGADLVAEADITFNQAVEGCQLSLRVEDQRLGVRTITARVPAGVRDGQKVRLPGKGRPGGPGGVAGDLVVTVHVSPHPVFTLAGADLRVTVPVTFAEAALGGVIEVPTLDGSTVKLKVAAGTPSGRVLRAKGRGVVTKARTGDLLVSVAIVVPQRLDEAAREAVEAFAKATAGEDVRAELLARGRGAGPVG